VTARGRGLVGLCGIAASLVVGHAASAQPAPLRDDSRPSVTGFVAVEPDPVAGLAYWHPVLEDPRASLAIGAGFKSAFLVPLRGDLRLNLSMSGTYQFTPSWRGACTASGYVARARDDAATLYGLGLELRCQPGYSTGSWQWALDLGWQGTLLTYVEHSDLSRRTFDDRYPPGVTGIDGPLDGWYRSTATRFRIGLSAAHVFRGRWSGAVAVGTLFALQDQGAYFAFNLAQIPIYLEVSTRYAW
jgi:hypothetical protein